MALAVPEQVCWFFYNPTHRLTVLVHTLGGGGKLQSECLVYIGKLMAVEAGGLGEGGVGGGGI